MGRAEDFLAAFTSIEQELRRIAGTDGYVPFAQLLREAVGRSATVARHENVLRDCASLRNAIVHDWRDGPIADPRESLIGEIQRIRNVVLDPPKVTSLGLSGVIRCRPTDSVGHVARLMYEHSFSQLPVYNEGDRWVDLLTTETIARWLGDRLATEEILLAEAVVEVLPFREESSREAFLPRTATLSEVLTVFDEAQHRGEDLDALLITESGQRDQEPLGILTVFDLPRVFRLTNGS